MRPGAPEPGARVAKPGGGSDGFRARAASRRVRGPGRRAPGGDEVARGRGDRPAPPAPGRAEAGAHPRGATARDEGPTGPGRLAERTALGHAAARRASTSRRCAKRSTSSRCRRTRTARSSAPTTTTPSTSSPRAARCASRCTPSSISKASRSGQEVVLNESLNVVLARGTESRRRSRHLQGPARRRHARARRRTRRRGARVRARRRAASARRSAPATTCSWTVAPGCCSRSCRGPRSKSSSSKRSPTSPTTTSAVSTTRSR